MTGLDLLSFSEDFFCDEVREGFFVSETMKRYWAAQLEVLSSIDRICRRHGYNWYADSGTLLGCVRHKGYIPWDDDLDIAMHRGEILEFLQFAQNELPDGYVILDPTKTEEYELPFFRITNSKVINAGAKFLEENHGCPFVAGVDIFPLDEIYEDASKEEDRIRRGNYVYQTLTGLLNKSIKETDLAVRIRKIEKENNVIIDSDTYRKLLLLFDRISMEANGTDSSEIAIIYRWVSKGNCKFTKDCYDDHFEMAFENTKIRVPGKYHEVLSATFGDYKTVVKGSAGHLYPVYRELEDKYREKFHKNPSRYNFIKEDYTVPPTKQTLHQKQIEILELMRGIHSRINDIYDSGAGEDILSFLQGCQNAAVMVGNTLEAKFGTGIDPVAHLEKYCEKIYTSAKDWNRETRADLDNEISVIEKSIDKLFIESRKDILFLPCRASWWGTMKEPFMEAVSDERNNVNVIPIPYFFHDHEKQIGEVKTDTALFERLPELKGKLRSFDEYGVERRHPDMIVIQFPYDGYSGILGTSELLYTDNLSRYTDELVYIPFANPDPPTSEDDVSYASMLELIEQPAVFYADRIAVGSFDLKIYYIKWLLTLTDESMKKYWEKRIITSKELFNNI